MLTETRYISADSVRDLCVANNWYTRGTTEQYDNLLYGICKDLLYEEYTDAEFNESMLWNVVTDIAAHTNCEPIKEKYGLDDRQLYEYFGYLITEHCVYTSIVFEGELPQPASPLRILTINKSV